MTTPTMKMMTGDDYRAQRLRYGPELQAWPAPERQRAEQFLATPLGCQTETSEAALDALLLAPANAAVTGDASAFLARLKDIPAQAALAPDPAGGTGWLRDLWHNTSRWLSPTGLVSQGVAFVLVLGVGIMVGLQSEAEFSGSDLAADAADAYDVSAQLFASGSELYLEEE